MGKQLEEEQRERELMLERERLVAEEKRRKEMEAAEPHTLAPADVEPPIDLPLWCVVPRRQDIAQEVELVRLSAGQNAVLKRVWLGRRSWALLGRRQPPEHMPKGARQPDIGLAAERASRSHAMLLRNWLGQVFLLD